MNQSAALTLEQEFNLRSFADIVAQMSREQAQEFLLQQHRIMMIRESMYRDLIKQQWKSNFDTVAEQNS